MVPTPHGWHGNRSADKSLGCSQNLHFRPQGNAQRSRPAWWNTLPFEGNVFTFLSAQTRNTENSQPKATHVAAMSTSPPSCLESDESSAWASRRGFVALRNEHEDRLCSLRKRHSRGRLWRDSVKFPEALLTALRNGRTRPQRKRHGCRPQP